MRTYHKRCCLVDSCRCILGTSWPQLLVRRQLLLLRSFLRHLSQQLQLGMRQIRDCRQESWHLSCWDYPFISEINYKDMIRFVLINQPALLTMLTMSSKVALREAPPTRNPSMSFCVIKLSAFCSLTDPPYMILVYWATTSELLALTHFLMKSCIS